MEGDAYIWGGELEQVRKSIGSSFLCLKPCINFTLNFALSDRMSGGVLQRRIIGVCNFGGCPSVGTVVEAPAQSAQARIVPALDENGDAAGQSSHAAGGVNTELLINKMPPQR